MSMKDIFLAEFKQESWDSSVVSFADRLLQNDPKLVESARQQGIPADISHVLLCEMGECALDWMSKDVPALGDQSPASFLGLAGGGNALRAAIMRMPR
ncbi:hypothetical protein [Paenibacillus xylanilyticus]|uniref:Antitoxin Xre/MbcA/ParS-like toxin-binding domain-containing protein n=1 Tax=Paenibacillus xylanilyticus TaxID=248903 RepID=A0A7Y6EWF1_9BACL|nr:hypothetical protein [Paenibacillus xylanilyticus]NUU77711.1 hypothetical protein [Paenibacillus xylanilyticus]